MMQKLEITFLSDWHIGEGSGQPGHIDKLVRRHPIDNLPYVPAKTITGIWRDACEQLALGLDDDSTNGIWHNWVNLLFGNQPNEYSSPDISPQAATLTIRTARFPATLRKQLANSEKLKQALTFIKPSVQLDKNGQAIDNNLHFDEVVRAGAILEARIVLNEEIFTEAQKQTAYALLWAAAQTVQRLGGKRRRGLGRCQFKFDGIQKDEALIRLQQPEELPKAEALDSKRRKFTLDEPSNSNAWMEIALHLTLKSPVIIAQGELGNVIETQDYILGTHLLAAVSKLLGSKKQLNLFNDVVRGDIQIGNAYLEDAETRGLPVPMALFYKKDDNSGKVYNRLMINEAEAQLKQHRTGYLINEKNLVKTPLQLTTHGTIDDKYQRPSEAVGGVFSFQAIKTGTRLQSVLKIRQSIAKKLKQAHGDNWWQVLNTDISIGKSKKDDYGWVELKAKPAKSNSITIENNKQELTVWLCSDLLLRNSRLRPSTDITDLQEEIEKHLGVKLSPRNTTDERLAVLVRTTRIDGWHQNWGKPHSSYLGLAAGSCIVFKCIKGELDKNKLQALMQRGLGERRAEGFGEVRFNPSLLSKKIASLEEKQIELRDDFAEQQARIRIITKHQNNFFNILKTAACREDIQQAAVKLSADEKQRHKLFGWSSDKPSNSQLGALRAVLTRMQTEADKTAVLDWLTHLEATDNRKDKWKPEGLRFIKDILDNSNLIWEILELKDFNPKLWAEAVRTLFAIAMQYEQREREL